MASDVNSNSNIGQITIQLSVDDIEFLEEQYAICDPTDIIDSHNIVKPLGHSLNRSVSWFNTCDCAILTAWRQENDRKTKDQNNLSLQLQLRELGYGVCKITGWYPEDCKELARENSFLTFNLNNDPSFRKEIFKLSEEYKQECFLYKKAGRYTRAVYVYTDDNHKKGSEKVLGRLRINNMDAEAFSQIGSGRITFEKKQNKTRKDL